MRRVIFSASLNFPQIMTFFDKKVMSIVDFHLRKLSACYSALKINSFAVRCCSTNPFR